MSLPSGSPYPVNATFQVVISAASPDTALRLTFNSLYMRVANGSARLDIHDGTSTESPLVATVTGSDAGLDWPWYTGTGQYLCLSFVSSGQPAATTGFSAAVSTVRTIDMSSTCATTTPLVVPISSFFRLTLTSGAVYANNLDCSLVLLAEDNELTVALDVLSFSTEVNADTLVVRDGSTPRSPLLGALSGVDTVRRRYFSSGQSLYLRFTSNGAVTSSGFTAAIGAAFDDAPSYDYLPLPGLPVSVIAATSWSSLSIELESPAPATDNTVVISSGSPSSVVRLVVSSLNIGSDYVYIYNGRSNSSQLVASLTGSLASLAVTS